MRWSAGSRRQRAAFGQDKKSHQAFTSESEDETEEYRSSYDDDHSFAGDVVDAFLENYHPAKIVEYFRRKTCNVHVIDARARQGCDSSGMDVPRIDYYAVLDIPRMTTDKGVIRRAYLKKALQTHPDKNGFNCDEEATTAHEAFQLVSTAYETLSDQERKDEYDLRLSRGDKCQSHQSSFGTRTLITLRRAEDIFRDVSQDLSSTGISIRDFLAGMGDELTEIGKEIKHQLVDIAGAWHVARTELGENKTRLVECKREFPPDCQQCTEYGKQFGPQFICDIDSWKVLQPKYVDGKFAPFRETEGPRARNVEIRPSRRTGGCVGLIELELESSECESHSRQIIDEIGNSIRAQSEFSQEEPMFFRDELSIRMRTKRECWSRRA